MNAPLIHNCSYRRRSIILINQQITLSSKSNNTGITKYLDISTCKFHSSSQNIAPTNLMIWWASNVHAQTRFQISPYNLDI